MGGGKGGEGVKRYKDKGKMDKGRGGNKALVLRGLVAQGPTGGMWVGAAERRGEGISTSMAGGWSRRALLEVGQGQRKVDCFDGSRSVQACGTCTGTFTSSQGVGGG